VLGRNPPAAIALHAARPALPVGGLGNAVEQQVTDRVTRREVDVAIPGESGDLEIEIADVLLPGEDPEMVDLALVFVERRRGKIADAADGKPKAGGLAGDLRDLKLTARNAEDGGQSRRRVDDAGDVAKPRVCWVLSWIALKVGAGFSIPRAFCRYSPVT